MDKKKLVFLVYKVSVKTSFRYPISSNKRRASKCGVYKNTYYVLVCKQRNNENVADIAIFSLYLVYL